MTGRDLGERRPVVVGLAGGDRFQKVVAQHAGKGQGNLRRLGGLQGQAHVLKPERELECRGLDIPVLRKEK